LEVTWFCFDHDVAVWTRAKSFVVDLDRLKARKRVRPRLAADIEKVKLLNFTFTLPLPYQEQETDGLSENGAHINIF
jgi:hypothetical protein